MKTKHKDSKRGSVIQQTALLLLSLIISLCPAFADSPTAPSIVFPLMAPQISSGFGMRIHPILRFSSKHSGVDLAAPPKSHVRAILAGTVVFADTYAGYGKLVTIRHGDGKISMYAHLSEILANPGQKVTAGQIIGRVGSTGHSTGPHLHFEWRVNGIARDPLKVFPSLASDASG